MIWLAKIPWLAVATAGGVILYLVAVSFYWALKRRKRKNEAGP